MIKCEYCGALVNENDSFCPQCGAPVKVSDVSPSVKEFERLLIETGDSDKIEYVRRNSFESASTMGKILWILFWIVLWPILIFVYIFRRFGFSAKNLTPNESKRANIISNYVFDSDRKTLHESLLFIETQIDILAEMKKDGYTNYWINLWTSKAEQVYEKSKTSVGEDAALKEIFDRIKKRSKNLINNTKLFFSVALVLAAAAVIFIGYTIAQPFAYTYNIVHDTGVVPVTMKGVQSTNDIDASKVSVAGIMGDCFKAADQDVHLEFVDDYKYLDMTMAVVCKKSLSDEIDFRLADKIENFDNENYLSGVFKLNGAVYNYLGDYDMGGIQAKEVFNELLKAQPGDEIQIHLLNEVKSYDRAEDYKKVMEVSNFVISMELTYTNKHDADNYEFETLK